MTDPLPLADRLFGLETEYGLLVEGADTTELTEEARRLVCAWPGPWAGPWDYRAETPRQDLRGFSVERLAIDEADLRYDREADRRLPVEEQRSDRVLANGARFYNDHGHPEYATPECRSLRDLVAHDRAGERIALECARLRAEATGRAVHLFKNNTDFHGASYGCHESYLCARAVPFERLLHGMLPFLVTRILFAGAGKTGVETEGPFAETPFQLAQRADFISEIASVDTLARRPLFNTRDEPHADPRRYRRLHVICGDALMSEFATALKVGTTCLVLSLIEAGWEPPLRLRHPVEALRRLSRDPSFRWLVEREDGRTIRATDLQRLYLEAAQRRAGAGPETAWILAEWERLLDDLEADPFRTEDRLDWVAKRKLLETFREAEGLPWESDVLRSLDLAYHNVDPEAGLYAALEQGGQMRRLVEETAIEQARRRPPANTRAALRGAAVRRFAPEVRRIRWEGAVVGEGPGVWLPFPIEFGARPGDADLLSELETANNGSEAARLLAGAP